MGEYSAALRAYESAAAQAEPAALGRLEHKLGQLHERRGQWELADSHFCAALDQYRTCLLYTSNSFSPSSPYLLLCPWWTE